MKMKLVNLTEDTCINKILAVKNPRIDGLYEQCREQCEIDFYGFCPYYKPVSVTEVPIRQGRYKVLP
jgi:hypothetical protein